MDFAWIIPLLALVTLGIFSTFALVSAERTERRRKSADVEKSALASDGDSHSAAP